ncbi:MAG: winged helix-turn-helix transcriptional regulator [Thermoanaerobaculia bacterium]|nr:winged helix-turn-helix transcriptional regulator [Thermoanaerobaculia bacterium]
MHKAIGHPVRLRILSMLRGGPLCVCQMTVVVKLAGSTVSEHLSELRRAGLVVERKDGRWVEYRLAANPSAWQLLAAVWSDLAEDPEVKADSLVLSELRKVSLDELCSAELELGRIKRPKLTAALREAAKLRHAGEAAR